MRQLRHLKRKARGVFELLGVGLGLLVIPTLPRCAVIGLSRWIARVGYSCSGRDRAVALANLEVAYGDDLSPAEREQTARESFASFVLVILDVFWFSRFTVRRIRRYVHVGPKLDGAFQRGAGVFITAHLGNWEVMAQASALKGYAVTSVAKPLANRVVDRLLVRLRGRTGQTIVPVEGALRALVRTLRDGHAAAFLLDQETLPDDGGTEVAFFGRRVYVSNAPAALAVRVRAPVCVAFCRLRDDGHYDAEAVSMHEPRGTGADVEQLTQAVIADIEAGIRADPGAWLWMYKRWKRIPPGEDSKGYPLYAGQ